MKLDLYAYADALNLTLELNRYPNQVGRWTAKFFRTDTKDGPDDCCLTGTYGNGETPLGAMQDYVRRIRGKILVIDGGDRRFVVPKELEL